MLPCGDSALAVEFGDRVSAEVSSRVLGLDLRLARRAIPGLIETVPTYRSLLIHVDPAVVDFDFLTAEIHRACEVAEEVRAAVRRWRVPVVYGGAFGIDLPDLATGRGMSEAEFTRIHAGSLYRVYMIGFMPGFAYLGGLDPRLETPRREKPRPRIPSQSISIGGVQTAIGTFESPSGWHLIGRTPVRAFMPQRAPPFLYAPGDEIVFEPVPESEWAPLDAAAARGEPVAVRETS